MSPCEGCQDRLVELLDGDLEGLELRLVTDHLAECEVCHALHARLRTGQAWAALLPLENVQSAVTEAVLKAARTHLEGDAATTATSGSMLPLPSAGFWGRVRVLAVRPQVVMATVMVLAVVFGAWYVPRRTHFAGGGSASGTSAVPGDEVPALAPDAELTLAPSSPEVAPERVAAEGPQAGSPQRTTEARLERGLQAYGRSDYVAAIDELNAVVAAADVSESALPTAIHHLARSYRQRGDCTAATRRYEQLLRRSPAYNQTHVAMLEAGSCYRTLGNDLRARELLELALANPATEAEAQAELLLLGEAPRTRRPTRQQAPSRSSSDAMTAGVRRPELTQDAPF